MIDMPVPEHAKPHEVAIILLYRELRTVRRVQMALHYRKPQPIYRVMKLFPNLFTHQPINS